jgi:hypothetical protein
MTLAVLCGALADERRLRMFAAIAVEPDGIEVARLVPAGKDKRALERLMRVGLVVCEDDRFRVRAEVFRETLQRVEPAGAAPDATAPVAALFSRGVLVSMPRPGSLRTELLAHLAGRFEPERVYSEPEVRAILEPVYGDYAALRRYLVDEGMLGRDNVGSYWRTAAPDASAI